MHLREVIQKDLVWPELISSSKDEVLHELAQDVARHVAALDESALYEALTEREKLGSTGVEDGIAIPHAKVPLLDRIVLACGRSIRGLDFEAHDGNPTHLFFVLLAPANAAGMHLKVLARLSRLLKEARVRARLMAAGSGNELYNAIIDEDEKL